jgi:adhesin/invasin
MLSAFDAAKLTELYNTVQVSARDSLGATAHFAIPTIANGKAYVGTQTQLAIYGLLPLLSPVSGANQTGAAGTTLALPVTVQAVNPYTGAAISGVLITFSDGGKNGTFGTPTATTDSTGQASTTYTMPKTFTKPTITITGTSPGYAPATFVETVTAGSPASVTVVSGGSQSGTVTTTLPAPIVVKVTDSYGNIVTGVPVSFNSGGFGGTFSNNPVTTDSLGRASVSYTLPTKAGTILITASTGNVTSKNITERAVAASPSAVTILSGNNQSAKSNTLLPKSLSVSVKDQYGNAVAGVTVSFTDNGAGGTLSSATAITNASGQASVQYTTPPQSGPVTINGTVTGLTPVVFNETVL